MEEIWKPIEGYEGLYEISNLGNVKSFHNPSKPKILRTSRHPSGYIQVGLTKNHKQHWKLLHRLMAIAFIPNPENKYEVNHKNGIKSDYKLKNLEWNNPSENTRHSIKLGLQKMTNCISHPLSKPILQYNKNGQLIREWGSINDAAKVLGYSQGTLSSAANGRYKTAYGFIWKHKE